MNSEYIIVVPDQEVLTCVCGTNDTNLKLIEDHLGIPVYTKGNELSIDTDDENLRQEFQFIVDRIIDEVNDGGKNSSDIITSVLNMEKKADMENTSITVPGCIRKVYPHTQHQADYIQSMRSHDMVFCYGAAGSGKTFLAVAEALRLVLSHQKSRLILSRPIANPP